MTPSLEGWPTKAKEAPSPHEVRLAPLDTNPVFQSVEVKGHFPFSELKNIFHLLAQRLTLSRSLFSFCEVLTGSRTTKNIEASFAKSITLDYRLSDKSLIYIKKTID